MTEVLNGTKPAAKPEEVGLPKPEQVIELVGDANPQLAQLQAQNESQAAAIDRLHQELNDLRAQLSNADSARAAAVAERDAAVADKHTAQNDLAEFRDTVREKAGEYAREHSWCEVVDQAMKDMGLPPTDKPFEVRLQITGYIDTTVNAPDAEIALQDAIEEVDIQSNRSYELHDENFWVTDVETEIV